MTPVHLSAFRKRLADARQAIGDRDFEWYPYDSLANLLNLERSFGSRYQQSALAAAPGKVIADIGCGDGDLAFFLESLGCTVDAIDYPDSNHNGMQAIRTLKQHLGSGISIHEVDLDTQFNLPRKHYDLIVFLGILYHLKNPLYVLEKLARHTRYCILSTRVARRFPDGREMPQSQPIAYLVGEEELNLDATNFWIFSHAGLRRLFERSYWKVLEYASVGDTRYSTPVGKEHDERVFCLLESHYALANVDLLHGWHQVETTGTRWTMRQFAARIHLTTTAGPDRLRMRAYVPEDLLQHLGPLRLEIDIDGEPAAPAVLDRPGYHDIVRRFHTHGRRALIASFKLDKALPPDARDPRERGIIVTSVDCE
jgi:SAM-dependent methyltransferase